VSLWPCPEVWADTYAEIADDRLAIHLQGIRSIYNRPAGETVESLRAAIDALADDECEDYWQPTEGNARRALVSLVRLAEMRPDAIWQGD
jgi:hypothetical protein